MTDFIYHITSRCAWAVAQKSGVYAADSLASVGFMHCSRKAQILRVANAFYPSQHGLVILEIDPEILQPELRWEAGADKVDELFPHLYGLLNLEAVVRVFDFEPGVEGEFSLPAGIT
jgi:uncharacterized protein (DUF952 family)